MSDWTAQRDRRMTEPGAQKAYLAAKLAFDLGASVRELRRASGMTHRELAAAAGMSQPAVARFESGGTVPTIPLLERLAAAVDAELTVSVRPRTGPDPLGQPASRAKSPDCVAKPHESRAWPMR
jgi:transcriptional regulator with XRE-family HTH domain